MRQPYDPCFVHGADTAVDSHKRRCRRAGGPEEPMFSTPFTLHNLDTAWSTAARWP